MYIYIYICTSIYVYVRGCRGLFIWHFLLGGGRPWKLFIKYWKLFIKYWKLLINKLKLFITKLKLFINKLKLFIMNNEIISCIYQKLFFGYLSNL